MLHYTGALCSSHRGEGQQIHCILGSMPSSIFASWSEWAVVTSGCVNKGVRCCRDGDGPIVSCEYYDIDHPQATVTCLWWANTVCCCCQPATSSVSTRTARILRTEQWQRWRQQLRKCEFSEWSRMKDSTSLTCSTSSNWNLDEYHTLN